MAGKQEKPRSPERRAVENTRYMDRRAASGIIKLAVMVPADRLPGGEAAAGIRSPLHRPDPQRLPHARYPTAGEGVRHPVHSRAQAAGARGSAERRARAAGPHAGQRKTARRTAVEETM